VEHFDSANDASEALKTLATDSYDVLLLDINMLDLSGTQLVDQLGERNLPLPSIVFVTAHVERAVVAFERHTVDYVLTKAFLERKYRSQFKLRAVRCHCSGNRIPICCASNSRSWQKN
jgi:DNA-binding LytR/AlgR family response regulator